MPPDFDEGGPGEMESPGRQADHQPAEDQQTQGLREGVLPRGVLLPPEDRVVAHRGPGPQSPDEPPALPSPRLAVDAGQRPMGRPQADDRRVVKSTVPTS